MDFNPFDPAGTPEYNKFDIVDLIYPKLILSTKTMLAKDILESIDFWETAHKNTPRKDKDGNVTSDKAYIELDGVTMSTEEAREMINRRIKAGYNNEYYGENSYSSNDGPPTVIWTQERNREASEVICSTEWQEKSKLSLSVDGIDITAYTGKITLADTFDGVYSTLSFTVAKSDNAYLTDLIYTPKLGSIVQLGKGDEMFRGVIISVDDGNLYTNSYTAADFGFYLKTEETYQFDNIRADTAINIILDDLSVPIDYITEIDTLINEIYFDKSVADIIKDIFKISGDCFVFDFTPKGIRVYRNTEFEVYPTYTVASNIPSVSAFQTAHSKSHSESIDSMYNAIKAVSSKDNVYTELKTVFDNESISKYGFLQKIVSVDTEKENPDEVSEAKLNELDKINESSAISIFCDIATRVRSGCVLQYGTDKYFVKSSSAEFCDNGEHMKISMELMGV